MQYSKWGSKTCSLCEDSAFARTGVCIGCDAGMCKNYFHVTCAQSNGLLSEAHSEEADHADPFYAHCKLHSDKALIKRRKRNFNALKLKSEIRHADLEERKLETPSAEQVRIERKLKKHKTKYLANKTVKNEPWVPTQKMPRLLTTSASARRRLMYKAQLMGIDTAALEVQESQISALVDIRKKWHIPPAFSVEFIAYYLDRISRVSEIKTNLKSQIDSNKTLLEDQQTLRERYDQKIVVKQDLVKKNASVKNDITKFHGLINSLCPNKVLPAVEAIGKDLPVKPPPIVPSKPMTVPTAAALKMGVGFPLNNLPGTVNNSGRVLSTQRTANDALLHDCGICKKCTDQHLLAKCDTCHFYYHLGCLNPPLTRHPKKSKLYGWQCSECDKSDDSEPDITLPKAQRRSRVRYSKDGFFLDKSDETVGGGNRSGKLTDSEIVSPAQSVRVGDDATTDISLTSADEKPASESTVKKTVNRKRIKKAKSIMPPTTKNVVVELKMIDAASVTNIEQLQQSVVVPAEPLPVDKTDAEVITIESPETPSLPPPPPPQSTSTIANKKEKKLKKLKKSQPDTENSTGSELDKSIEAPPSDSSENNSAYLPQFTSEIITDPIPPKQDAKCDGGGEKDQSQQSPQAEGVAADLVDGGQVHHKNRKRKKDKHKSKHSMTDDSEKSTSGKEHKRKHKRKDMECSQEISEEGGPHPRIKIKFKAIHLPSDGTGNQKNSPKLIYVTHNDDTLPNDKPVEVPPKATSNVHEEELRASPPATKKMKKSAVDVVKSPTPQPQATHSLPQHTSPRRKSTGRHTSNAGGTDKKDGSKMSSCDVCSESGTPQNLVCCDECRKTYHFSCLDPPLKKSPKRRGYSWHCADCDPTDRESN